MDGRHCEVAQLRSRFHRPAKITVVESTLCRVDRSAKTARSIAQRSTRSRGHNQRGILFTGRARFASETPEEIALAIVAEIQWVFAGGSGESLRERKMSIHPLEESLIPSEC